MQVQAHTLTVGQWVKFIDEDAIQVTSIETRGDGDLSISFSDGTIDWIGRNSMIEVES